MDNIDNAVFTRVWQRVHPKETASADQLQLSDPLYWQRCLAATYYHLLPHFNAHSKALLRRLYRQSQTGIACLQGIYSLAEENPLPPSGIKPYRGNIPAVLRRCYRDALQCTCFYNSHSSHPEYGTIFLRLAQESQLHCQLLLQLLGTFSSKDHYVNTAKPVYFSPKR